ncbi:hypothetical protein D3C73_1320320 [compost metagenome]
MAPDAFSTLRLRLGSRFALGFCPLGLHLRCTRHKREERGPPEDGQQRRYQRQAGDTHDQNRYAKRNRKAVVSPVLGQQQREQRQHHREAAHRNRSRRMGDRAEQCASLVLFHLEHLAEP